MTRHPSIADALEIAEGLDEDHHDWREVRELKIALRCLAKDAEAAA